MIVPEFLLRRLYVRGSLCNTAAGVEFELKNSLGGGYASGMLPISVDGSPVALDDCFFRSGEGLVPFTAVTQEAPFTLARDLVITVSVRRPPIEAGNHTLRVGFIVLGLGELAFEVTDVVAEQQR